MTTEWRSYRYVGPAELKARVRPGDEGHSIRTPEDLARWLSSRGPEERAEPFTFVIGTDGLLRLAPRRSEHVSRAGGAPVLSASEMSFHQSSGRWSITDVSNQSSGYCPDPSSWPSVAAALGRAGIGHPGASATRWCSAAAPAARRSTSCARETSSASSASRPSPTTGTWIARP